LIFGLASLTLRMGDREPTRTAVNLRSVDLNLLDALLRDLHVTRAADRIGLSQPVVALGFTVDPTIASAILTITTWHWLFLINVPAGLIAIELSVRARSQAERASRGFDVIAALLCAGSFALIIFGLAAIAQDSGWPVIAAEWLIAIVCGYALLRREAGHSAPILAVDLFRRPAFSLSALTSVCSFAT
jgi:MFS transporter, DHA2 family, multidrug resistance protein